MGILLGNPVALPHISRSPLFMTCVWGATLVTYEWYVQHPKRKREGGATTKIAVLLFELCWGLLGGSSQSANMGDSSLLQLLHKAAESQLNKKKMSEKNNSTRIKAVFPPKPELDSFLWILEDFASEFVLHHASIAQDCISPSRSPSSSLCGGCKPLICSLFCSLPSSLPLRLLCLPRSLSLGLSDT